MSTGYGRSCSLLAARAWYLSSFCLFLVPIPHSASAQTGPAAWMEPKIDTSAWSATKSPAVCRLLSSRGIEFAFVSVPIQKTLACRSLYLAKS